LARTRSGLPLWLIVTGGALLVINVVGLLWLIFRPASVPATAASPASPVHMQAGDAPALAAADTRPVADAAPEDPAVDALAVSEPTDAAAGVEAPEDARIAGLPRYSSVDPNAPRLRLDLHVYSSLPAQRYALINMRKLREGESNEDGVTVREITRSGVVLLYRGEEFLLARD
jgi:general secretion pathway protein B